MKYLTVLFLSLTAYSTGASAQEFKVMTYNIRGDYHTDVPLGGRGDQLDWSIRRDGVFKVIADANPDIFSLQEDTLRQTKDVQDHFQSNYRRADIKGKLECEADAADEFTCEAGISGHGAGVKQSYGSIFFKTAVFEELDQGEVVHQIAGEARYITGSRYFKWVKLRHKASNRELYVSNTHLTHQGSSSNIEKHAAFIAAQERSVERLAMAIWPIVGDTPYISLGDMNNIAKSKTVRYLTSEKGAIDGANYGDSHQKLQFNFRRVTFNYFLDKGVKESQGPWQFGPDNGGEWIDHILTSSNLSAPIDFQRFNRHFKPSSFRNSCRYSYVRGAEQNTDAFHRLGDCRESDHFALMATVSFKGGSAGHYYNYLRKKAEL